jgi:hypothetical protein
MFTVKHMSNDDFQAVAQPGDHLTVYKSHAKDAPIAYKDVEFLGYIECTSNLSCRDRCKGYIKIKVPGLGTMSECLRSDINIRVKILQRPFLDEELFKI